MNENKLKSICIVHSNMEIGGAEISLIGLLKSIDYSKYTVDLLLLNPVGELMNMIPKEVNILNSYSQYKNLLIPIKSVIRSGRIDIAITRMLGKLVAKYNYKIKKLDNVGYMTKEYSHKYTTLLMPNIKTEYDLGISFIDPHYILGKNIKARVKLGWLHTDISRVQINFKTDFKMWDKCDYIVNVSESCKKSFDLLYPELKHKSIVIENIISEDIIKQRENEFDVKNEITKEKGTITICSVGRFSEAKNFDNIPNICKRILDQGINIRWYIIGYGNDEEKIRKKISEEKVDESVIILGKKENPYPYIKACDIYVQPSRYEGKAVTVREAQILNKPVIITNFKTAQSQLKDGVDGVIVPMDNKGCADGIISVLKNKKLIETLIDNTKKFDYSNRKEIETIYKLMGD